MLIDEARVRPDEGARAGTIPLPGGAWSLFAPLLFRSTGFPFDWLMELRLEATITSLETLEALARAAEAARARFLDHGFATLLAREETRPVKDKAAIARVYAIRSAMLKDRPVAASDIQALESAPWVEILSFWNESLAARDAAEARARDAYATETAARRAKLWELARSPDLIEAIFLSSPSAAESLIKRNLAGEAGLEGDSKTRGLERRLYAYLQRFCAKNDTTSFFGPVDYGVFAREAGEALAAEPGWPARASRRRAFWAHWVVAALARGIAEDDRVFLELWPRRNPLLRIVDAARGVFFLHAADRELRLDGPARDLLLAADGETTVAELADVAGLAPATAMGLLRRLAAAKLLAIELAVPSTEVDAFAALRRAVEALPPEARLAAKPRLDAAEALRSEFEAAPWPARKARFDQAEAWVAAHLGDAARRKDGALYADRLALYEDCAGSLRSLVVGGAALARIERSLPDVLEFLTGVAALRWRDAQDAARAHLEKGASARFIDFLTRFAEGEAPRSRFDALAARLRQLMETRRRDDRIELSAEDLRFALAPWRDEIARALAAFPMILPSPDLMIAAASVDDLNAGAFDLVLAELHDDCSTLFDGFFACFHPDPPALRAVLRDEIMAGGDWRGLGGVLGGRRNKHITPELPGATILLSGVANGGNATVPISEVEIVDEDGRLALRARGASLTLYPGDVSSRAHEAFALPRVVPIDWLGIAGGDRIPRVTVNGIVAQRAAWDVPADALKLKPKGELALADFRALRVRLKAIGAPECFFARWAIGEKPVLIDARNPIALDLLRRVADQATRFKLTEMHPGPDAIFWPSARGRHTFELRTGLIRRNPAAASRGAR